MEMWDLHLRPIISLGHELSLDREGLVNQNTNKIQLNKGILARGWRLSHSSFDRSWFKATKISMKAVRLRLIW